MISITSRGTILGILVTVAACGGGGGGGGGDGTVPLLLEALAPAVLYGAEETELTINGEGIRSDTGDATIRFTATVGTPFRGGTTNSIEVRGSVVSDETIRATLPPTHVDETTQARITVDLPGLGETTLDAEATFEPQAITSFTPVLVDGSRSVPYVITGRNFRPVGETVAISFLLAAPHRFHTGTSPTGQPALSAAGYVVSSTKIQGAIPYAGVTADALASLHVSLPTGALLTSQNAATFQPGTTGVRGTWTYEAPDSTLSGLDYTNISENPVRRARVQLVDANSNAVITTRVLGEDGGYEIHYGMDDLVKVRVLAETGPPAASIRVEDNTNDDALWSSEGSPFQVLGSWEDRDYTVPLGWDGSAYTTARASGPFALLDAVYAATRAFEAVRTVEFPACKVNWSPDNRPSTDLSYADGRIVTSHYDPTSKEFYVLGQEDVDTDEFDTHIVVHEWGHYFEDNLSRADTYGGEHSDGDRLEPTVAFSEGTASALSALVLYPDTTLTDSYDLGQAEGWGFDLEANASDTNNPGWFSESSVQWLVYDLFDDDAESWDSVSLGLGVFYDVQTTTLKDTSAFTTIFAFVDACIDAQPSAGGAIQALCQHHQISPVQDEWGTGEANNGGWSANLPVYHLTPAGTSGLSLTLDGRGSARINEVSGVRFLRIPGNGGFVTVEAITTEPAQYIDDHDIFLEVYEDGVVKGWSDDVWYGTESVRFQASSGRTYTARIFDLSLNPNTYSCTVNVKAQ